MFKEIYDGGGGRLVLSYNGDSIFFSKIIYAPANMRCPLGLCSLGSQARLEVMKELKTK